MSRESEVATLLRADATLRGLLPGGIYSYMQLGVAGITDRKQTPDVWTGGSFRPCAIVKDRAPTPFGNLRDEAEGVTAISQVVEIYFYEVRGTGFITQAKERTYSIMANPANRLSGAYPSNWVLETPPIADVEQIANSITLRQDWQIISLRGI